MQSVGACIFKNMAILIGFATVCVSVCMLSPAVRKVVQSGEFRGITLVLCLVSLATILLSKNVGRVLMIVYIATVMSMLVISSISSAKTVFQALATTFCVFSVMAFVGRAHKGSLTGWGPLLLAVLVCLIVASVLNMFVRSGPGQFAIALVGSLLFSLFVVYDVNRFTRYCEGDECCKHGTLALWLDFVNLFNDILILQR